MLKRSELKKIALVASDTPEAQDALEVLSSRYESVEPRDADVVVALGGDGLMLHCLHDVGDYGAPIYGMNRGTVGFLMNHYAEEGLPERLAAAVPVTLHPLRMRATTVDGHTEEALGFNEISLLRQTKQTAKVQIRVDGVVRMEELACDGILLATPAGSTAYNLSAHGPILPIDSNLLALTPISPFRPRRWRGALLRHTAEVTWTIREPDKRPVSATADYLEVRRVSTVVVAEDRNISVTLLFDPDHSYDERIMLEQFSD